MNVGDRVYNRDYPGVIGVIVIATPQNYIGRSGRPYHWTVRYPYGTSFEYVEDLILANESQGN